MKPIRYNKEKEIVELLRGDGWVYYLKAENLSQREMAAGTVLAWRKIHGLSLKELAERAGTSIASLSRLEDPDYSGKIELFEKVMNALGKRIFIKII